ncbi:PAS domain S-box protein [Kamptonema formosum]|uniref:PAS domain S-box protein n=1 Tax=Kamptonema formosum TaxID=331992 RepID=UPI0003451AB9|nr:PAS domain S-box protein [Oscillatoria sp. PCC 10802]
MANRKSKTLDRTRSQLEAKRRDSEEQFRLMAETAPFTIWIADGSGGWNYCNSVWLELTGRPLSGQQGMGWLSSIHPEDRQRCRDTYLAAVKVGEKFQIECRSLGASGECRWVMHAGAPRFAPDGSLMGYTGTATDITDTKIAEIALQRGNEDLERRVEERTAELVSRNAQLQQAIAELEAAKMELDRLFSVSADLLAIADMDGYFKRVNPAVETILGYTAEEFLAARWIELIHPDDRARTVAEGEEQIATGKPSVQFENRYRCKDGSYKWLAWNSMPVPEEGFICAVARDITERKHAEEALRESEQRYQTLARLSPVGIFRSDAEGNNTYANERWCEIAGQTLETAGGNGWAEAVHPEDRERAFTAWRTAALSGVPFQNEMRLVRPDGSLVWCLVQAIPEMGEDGRLRGYVGTVTDISDRKQAEIALQESEARFQGLAENLPGLIYQYRYCAGNPRGEFPYISAGCCDLFELEPETVVRNGDLIWQQVHPEDERGLAESVLAAAHTGQWRREWRSITPSGKIKWIQGVARLKQEVDGIMLWDGLMLDITERKFLEEELALRQAQFDAFFTAAPAGMVILDTDLRYSQINRALAAMGGRSVGDYLGKTLREAEPQLAEAIEPLYRQMLATGKPLLNQELSGEIASDPGVDRHWLCSYFPLPGQDGTPIGLGAVVVEITDLKQAEQAQARLTALLEATTDFVAMSDAAGRMIYVNRAGRLMVGIGEDEDITALTIPDFIPDSEIEKSASEIIPTCVSEGVWRGEFALQHRNGTVIPVSQVSMSHKSESGEVEFLSVIARDITQRVQAEEALRKSEGLYRTLVDNFPDGAVFLFDPDLRYILAGGSELERLGFDSASVEGKNAVEFWPAGARERIAQLHRAAIAGEVRAEENAWSGNIYFMQTLPVKNHQGEIFAGMLVSQNITEYKQAEEALRQSEAQLREQAQRAELLNRLASQIRQSLDLDTLLKTAVNSTRNVLAIDRCHFAWYRPHANPPSWEVIEEAKAPALPSQLGFYPASDVGPVTDTIIAGEMICVSEADKFPEPIFRQFLLKLGHKSEAVLPIKTRSEEIGVLIFASCYSAHYWSQSEIELLQAVSEQVGIAINQAELYERTRKAAQEATAKSQQLELALQQLQRTQSQLIQSEKMSSLGQLVAGVAHEINNPVSFIYGNVEHAREYAGDLLSLIQLYRDTYPHPAAAIEAEIEAIDLDFLTEDMPKLLDSMKMGAERIGEIVRSLRTFSRLDEAAVKEVNLHEGIDSTLMILQNRLKQRPDHPAIQVIKEYGDLPLVECCAGQLNQVFMNLLNNAIDALDEQQAKVTPEDLKANPSTIKIVTSALDKEWVAISIADSGSGIPEAVKKRLFDPFFTTKPVGKGTGLGLSISYQIVVEKHGGRLYCNSQLGKGAEFVMEIPVRQSR